MLKPVDTNEAAVSSPFDAVVFDLDGLMVDTEAVVQRAWIDAFDARDISFDVDQWARAVGGDDDFRPLETLVQQARVSVEDRAAVRTSIEFAITQGLDGIAPLPGVVDWVRGALDLGLRVAVASNSPRSWVLARLEQIGLLKLIGTISSRDESPRPKPFPDIYLAACARLDVEPSRAFAVEDSMTGLVAAKSAGLLCVVVPNSLTRTHNFEAADLHLASLASMAIGDAVTHLAAQRKQIDATWR
jgi:HAD superfamily hydrolase (TIGR01509 family)